VVAGYHAPTPESLGELKRVPVRAPAQLTSDLARFARDRHVEVDRRAPEQAVADGAADEVTADAQIAQDEDRVGG
jgi:hypothetical protein